MNRLKRSLGKERISSLVVLVLPPGDRADLSPSVDDDEDENADSPMNF
jgi:hypothetical protein